MQGPDGGFDTGYDQLGTYAGTQENVETTSIAVLAINSLSRTGPFPFPFPFFSIPPWIIYLFIGLAAAAVTVVITVIVLDQRKRKTILARPPIEPRSLEPAPNGCP